MHDYLCLNKNEVNKSEWNARTVQTELIYSPSSGNVMEKLNSTISL